MKRALMFLVMLLLIPGFSLAQNAWINEIHYDDAATDDNEMVEVVIEASFTDLASMTLTRYNGSNGTSYRTTTLDNFTVGVTEDGFTLYHFTFPTNGLQNGAPDGLALDNNGTLIQFLSYEGTFTGSGGPADGVLSEDIGVSETGGTVEGTSLQLTGTGTQYSDFTWAAGLIATPGTTNDGGDQGLPVSLVLFSASAGDGKVTLKWATASEIQNTGFEVMRATAENGTYSQIGFRQGQATATSGSIIILSISLSAMR